MNYINSDTGSGNEKYPKMRQPSEQLQSILDRYCPNRFEVLCRRYFTGQSLRSACAIFKLTLPQSIAGQQHLFVSPLMALNDLQGIDFSIESSTAEDKIIQALKKNGTVQTWLNAGSTRINVMDFNHMTLDNGLIIRQNRLAHWEIAGDRYQSFESLCAAISAGKYQQVNPMSRMRQEKREY